MKTRRLLGYFFEGRRFDVGTAAGYVETMIEVALHRPDTRAQTRAVRPASAMRKSYEIFSTTADVGIRIRGNDFTRALAQRPAGAE